MRYSTSEKFKIISTVDGSHLKTEQILDMLGIPRTTLYRWYDLHLKGGLDGLSDKPHSLCTFGPASPIRAVII